ncbi:DUF4389 domain-containing protein [Pseudolysinimonas sp.]|jgi:hypothetical protein|uniref:DUF4389 domain-containing protein n=1 Tax=Pseudolysinimonas sp. TaxID=2680009 RepID=UPI00378522D7
MSAPEITSPSTSPRGGWFAVVIVGSLLALFGGPVLGAVGAASSVATSRADGVVLTHPVHASAPGYALTSPSALIETSLDPASFPQTSVTLAAGETDGEPVFIGIGPAADVAAYLADVHVAEVTGLRARPLEIRTRDIPGQARPDSPAAQDFWVASDSGSGVRELSWTLEPGDWTVVIMNEDASPGLDTRIQVGLAAPWAAPLATALIVTAAVVLVAGLVLMVVGVVGWGRRQPLTTVRPVGPYPATLRGELRTTPSRGLWLVKWILIIPHVLVLGLLWIPFVLTTIVAWFAILITGRYPRPLFAFTVGFLRWAWRVGFYAYSALGTDVYPPFSLQRTDYPADFDVAYPERLSRGLVLVKSWLLALPHLLVVGILTGGAAWGYGSWRDTGTAGAGVSLLGLLVLVAAVVLLFTGRYQRPLFDLIMGLNRWTFRVAAYVSLMRDEYPPFRLDQGADEPAAAAPASRGTES